MSYMKNIALDTRTCGEADEDARLDRRDRLTRRITTNRARWAAATKRLDEREPPFASLRNIVYTECPCGCGFKGVCEAQLARVRSGDAALEF